MAITIPVSDVPVANKLDRTLEVRPIFESGVHYLIEAMELSDPNLVC